MTLDDLASSLPNGLHDAQLKSVTVNYVAGEARLLLDIWMGDLEAATEAEREKCAQAEIILTGLAFWVCEPPDSRYPFNIHRGLRIDTGPVHSLRKPPLTVLPPVPEGLFLNWIFVSDWNAFIYVAARHARLEWRP